MCDSISIDFAIQNILSDSTESNPLPFKQKGTLNEFGELNKSISGQYFVKSPLTGAQFCVSAILVDYRNSPRVEGYRVEANIPACSIGNNAFVQNHVRSASRIALELLKYWLRDSRCGRESIESLTLESSEIQWVTLTYLYALGDRQLAVKSVDSLQRVGDALYNNIDFPDLKKHVLSVGSERDKTGYFIHREFRIAAYVKCGKTDKGFAVFKSKETESAIYRESSGLLRCEITLHKKWLRTHGLIKPKFWHRHDGNPNSIAFDTVREYFRFNDRLRKRRPRPEDLAKLADFDRRVVDLHLSGQDVRNHPDVPQLNDRKSFSRIKRRIEGQLRIDISIPWSTQIQAVNGELEKLLTYEGKYKPKSEFLEHTFTKKTAKSAIRQLKNVKPDNIA